MKEFFLTFTYNLFTFIAIYAAFCIHKKTLRPKMPPIVIGITVIIGTLIYNLNNP